MNEDDITLFLEKIEEDCDLRNKFVKTFISCLEKEGNYERETLVNLLRSEISLALLNKSRYEIFDDRFCYTLAEEMFKEPYLSVIINTLQQTDYRNSILSKDAYSLFFELEPLIENNVINKLIPIIKYEKNSTFELSDKNTITSQRAQTFRNQYTTTINTGIRICVPDGYLLSIYPSNEIQNSEFLEFKNKHYTESVEIVLHIKNTNMYNSFTVNKNKTLAKCILTKVLNSKQIIFGE